MGVEIKESNSKNLLESWQIKEKCRRKKGMLRQDFMTFSADFSSNHSYIAEKNNEVIGFIIFRDTGYISIFGVDPEHTREGIGTKLINKAKEKYEKLWCHVRETNEEAIKFYRSNGFEESKTVSSYYLNGDNAKLMVYKEK